MSMSPPDLPFVSTITDDEVALAVAEYALRKHVGLDPAEWSMTFKVSYRQVRAADGSARLFAAIAITSVDPKTPSAERPA